MNISIVEVKETTYAYARIDSLANKTAKTASHIKTGMTCTCASANQPENNTRLYGISCCQQIILRGLIGWEDQTCSTMF